MGSHALITELDESDPIDQLLDQLFKAHKGDAKRLIARTFRFLEQRTSFFEDPDTSKVLARLLRDVQKPAIKSAQNNAGVAIAAKHSPPPATKASPSGPPKEGPVPKAEAGQNSAMTEDEDDEKEEKLKGLRPNAGNGSDMEKYSWNQTLAEVGISVPVPKGTKGKQCEVTITKDSLKVGLKGEEPILKGELPKAVQPEECLWSLDNNAVEISLQKVDRLGWWPHLLKGEPEIDIGKVEPENSKLSDLDGETRATVEKMMFDQRQKQLGLPTSEEANKQEMLKKFMAAHPEMDFSKAKFM